MKENNKYNKQRPLKVDIDEFVEVRDESPAEVETTGPETKNGIIDGAMNVKVRREPRIDANNVVEILRKGDKVTILGKVDGFYMVSTSVNNVAYISSDFIREG